MKTLIVLFNLLITTICFGQLKQFTAIGIGAFDGDSPTIRVNDSTFHVRLYGIDAPERQSLYVTKPQPGNKEAGLNLRALISKDTLIVIPYYIDQFDRLVCRIFTSDSIDVSADQLYLGNAWVRKESGMNKTLYSEYKALHDSAKSSKKGLWGIKGKKYTPSWWRKTYSGWKER